MPSQFLPQRMDRAAAEQQMAGSTFGARQQVTVDTLLNWHSSNSRVIDQHLESIRTAQQQALSTIATRGICKLNAQPLPPPPPPPSVERSAGKPPPLSLAAAAAVERPAGKPPAPRLGSAPVVRPASSNVGGGLSASSSSSSISGLGSSSSDPQERLAAMRTQQARQQVLQSLPKPLHANVTVHTVPISPRQAFSMSELWSVSRLPGSEVRLSPHTSPGLYRRRTGFVQTGTGSFRLAVRASAPSIPADSKLPGDEELTCVGRRPVTATASSPRGSPRQQQPLPQAMRSSALQLSASAAPAAGGQRHKVGFALRPTSAQVFSSMQETAPAKQRHGRAAFNVARPPPAPVVDFGQAFQQELDAQHNMLPSPRGTLYGMQGIEGGFFKERGAAQPAAPSLQASLDALVQQF